MSTARRDALLSRLCGEQWPFAPLLDTVQVSPDARVLDIGGGEGGLLRELERRGHTGPRHTGPREPVDPLRGSDAHALPFPDGCFDVVFMLRVLGHLHTPDQALAEALRVLAPGGRRLVAAHGPEHLAGVLPPGRPAALPSFLAGMWAQEVQVSRPVVLSAADVQALAASSGLGFSPTGELRSQMQLSGWVISRYIR